MRGPSPADPRTRRIRLAYGRAAVEIAPGQGARIAALEVDGWDVVRRDGWTDNEWGIFVMAPWVGRLRNARVAWDGREWEVPATEAPHALHGLVSAIPWSVAAESERSVRLEASLGDAWPTGGWLVQTVTLAGDRLILRLDVHAELEPTPAILGWHPWFRRRAVRTGMLEIGDPATETEGQSDATGRESGDVTVQVSPRRRVELDEHGLPTGVLLDPREGPLDDVPLDDVLLGLTTPPVVHWPGGPRLALHASGVAAWIAYTAHPDGVCVEPVTGIPDGINGGLLGEPPVARAREPLSATFEIAWS